MNNLKKSAIPFLVLIFTLALSCCTMDRYPDAERKCADDDPITVFPEPTELVRTALNNPHEIAGFNKSISDAFEKGY